MEKFVQLNSTEIELIISKKLANNDLVVYLYLCSKMTFAHGIFGIFSNKTVYSIHKDLGFSDKSVAKRAISKLAKMQLITVINSKGGLILSKNPTTVDQLKALIEAKFADFNLTGKRLDELEEVLKIKFDRAGFFEIWKNKQDQKKTQEIITNLVKNNAHKEDLEDNSDIPF